MRCATTSAAQPSRHGLVVGNGDHVEQLAKALDNGASLTAALEDVEPEPDPPIRTPRIGAVIGSATAKLFRVTLTGQGIERDVIVLDGSPGSLATLTTYEGPRAAPVPVPEVLLKDLG